MPLLGLALIVTVFGAMAIVFGAQERAAERRTLAWAEETLARLAAEARADSRGNQDEAGPERAGPPRGAGGAPPPPRGRGASGLAGHRGRGRPRDARPPTAPPGGRRLMARIVERGLRRSVGGAGPLA